MPEIKYTPLTEDEIKSYRVEGIRLNVEEFFNAVFLGTWKTLDLTEQIKFRHRLEGFTTGVATLRSKFDSDVWEGHENGSVDIRVESIRAKRKDDSAKPGRKPVEKSMADHLLK